MTRRIGGDGRDDVARCRTYRPEGGDDLGLAVERDPSLADFLILAAVLLLAWLVVAMVAVALYRSIRHNPEAYGLLTAVFVVAAVWCWTHDKAKR